MTALDRARENLAEALADTGPYAAQNVAAHRARVAKLEAEQAPAKPAPAVPVTPVAATPKPKPVPILTGTREERLERLAKAMGASDAQLAEAVAAGTSPDDFAIEIVESRDPEAVAQRIISSVRQPQVRKYSPEVEDMAQRILNA